MISTSSFAQFHYANRSDVTACCSFPFGPCVNPVFYRASDFQIASAPALQSFYIHVMRTLTALSLAEFLRLFVRPGDYGMVFLLLLQCLGGYGKCPPGLVLPAIVNNPGNR
jgi:hypothetical protein